MLIDFHMHLFPDAIAQRAIDKLARIAGIPPQTDGTLNDTRRKMKLWGVDRGVILNIATNPHQQHNVNNFAASIKAPDIIPFGSVHWEAPDRLEELDRIRELGLLGVKLHPDYQGFMIDDPRMDPVYERISDLGLIAAFHCGYDCVSPDLVHAMPSAVARVAKRFPKLKLVAAHLGGLRHWDEVEAHLVGTDVYLDTSFLSGEIDPAQMKRILLAHDSSRLLFGSDCPWLSSAESLRLLRSLGLPQALEDRILSENALALLGKSEEAAV